jgi:hypothetical protein
MGQVLPSGRSKWRVDCHDHGPKPDAIIGFASDRG